MSLLDRFEGKYIPEPNSGCWLWTASLNTYGYGQIYVRDLGRHDHAHRVSWELFKGEIPVGMDIDHLCRVRSCVNPDHMQPVSPRENIMRGTAPPALNSVKTHCSRGHEFNSQNTSISHAGKRACRQCRLITERLRNKRKRAI